MEYRIVISSKMRAVSEMLTGSFIGMDHCITETRRNLIVEVPKRMCEKVRTSLKCRFPDVALIRNALFIFLRIRWQLDVKKRSFKIQIIKT